VCFGSCRKISWILAFAGNIGMHLETWLDFLLDEEEDLGGLCVSFSVMKRTRKK
jgi:hypothetical protein